MLSMMAAAMKARCASHACTQLHAHPRKRKTRATERPDPPYPPPTSSFEVPSPLSPLPPFPPCPLDRPSDHPSPPIPPLPSFSRPVLYVTIYAHVNMHMRSCTGRREGRRGCRGAALVVPWRQSAITTTTTTAPAAPARIRYPGRPISFGFSHGPCVRCRYVYIVCVYESNVLAADHMCGR